MPVDPIANLIAGVLVTQLVLGGLSLIGFYHQNRRFMTTEFPAQIARIDSRFQGQDVRLEKIEVEMRDMRRAVDRHEIILSERRGDDLDDTRSGVPRRRRT